MGNAYGTRLRLRLFLEGIEVPIISANVRSAPNSPSAASIQIPPLPEGTRFLPRTLVHVYFLDLYEQTSPLIRKLPDGAGAHQKALDGKPPATDPTEGTQSLGQGMLDSPNGQYKLLFGGEVVGFQWTKNASARSLVLQCLDWSNYWDYAYQWGNTDIFGPGIKAVFSGGATNLFTDFLTSKGSALTRIATSGKCNSFPKLRGLAAGIVRLIEAIGGSFYPKASPGQTPKKLAGQNLFFSSAELRLHITHMVAAFEDDPTSSKILRRQGYAGMFDRMLGGLGAQVSIRKAINALQGVMFHETYGQPCPYFKPSSSNQTETVTVRGADDPRLAPLVQAAQEALGVVKGLRSAPRADLIDIADNPAAVASAEGVRNTQTEFLTVVRQNLRQAIAAIGSRAPASLTGKLSQAAMLSGKAAVARSKVSVQATELGYKDYYALLDKIIALLTTAISTKSARVTRIIQGDPPRLNQHILRPDIWFGAPPRCNVLFPDDYDSLSYQRMFLEEPTRFLLKTNDEFFGEDFLFDKFYFAPQAGSVSKDKARILDVLRNDMLEHELFTGILPVFEKMGEFNVFAAKSGTDKTTSKNGLAQRSTNFLYFKHRFASRQMQISGRFNPYIAVGFPGLVIDKYVDQVTIRTYNDLLARENDRRTVNGLDNLSPSRVLGTNFLANFTEVSHHVSQAESTGRTLINCGYARQPDESIEFLGALPEEQLVRKRQDKDALRATDVAAITPPKLGAIGPMGGKIVNVTDVTSQYTRQSGSSKPLPLFGRTRRDQGGQLRAPRVQVGVPTSGAALQSPDVSTLTGGRDVPVVFRAYRVDEEIARYKKEPVILPAEEFIRPGWYGDIWSPPNIGKVYEDFFGTGAITDSQSVTDANMGNRSVPSEDMADANLEASQAEASDDPRRFAPAVVALDKNASIQQAVDFLLLTYSFAKLSGADVDQFVRSYTWRPIATMVDMLGTSDLKFSNDGQKVLSGIEGFHSRAFGPYDNLFGLVNPEIENILGIKRGSTAAQKADTRKRRYEAVQSYVSALLFSRGLLG
jgi:hypothetical protein